MSTLGAILLGLGALFAVGVIAFLIYKSVKSETGLWGISVETKDEGKNNKEKNANINLEQAKAELENSRKAVDKNKAEGEINNVSGIVSKEESKYDDSSDLAENMSSSF